MTIKNLLIAYNGGEASDAAVRLAMQMARKYDAHLTGIVAHGASTVTRNIPKWLSASMRASITEITAQRTDELAEKFHALTQGQLSSDKVHWIDVKDDPDRAVTEFSRFFDLTVLGQYENLIEADELVLHPDRIAYESGRPILVAPKGYKLDAINEKAVVAWDGRRSSSRAFFDAMQVLETKDNVDIVTIGDVASFNTPKSVDLVSTLARHGVSASRHFLPMAGSVAQTLLNHCDATQAGLLVMGAYQHSKLSEDIFGGVTASVLKHANIPLFLSH